MTALHALMPVSRLSLSLGLAAVAFVCSACEDGPAPEPAAYEAALELGPDEGALLSVWGSQPDRVFAVGGQPEGAGDFGILYAFDGDHWTAQQLPVDTPMLNWVFGVGDTVWLVGDRGAALRGQPGNWQASETGTDLPLWGIWGTAEDDLWSVGGDPFDPPDNALQLLHFDGSAWTAQTVPNLDRECAALFKVWGTGPDNVYAVGDAGVVLHFDGDQWQQELSGTGSDLISLWGSSADEIVVAGGRSNGTVARWNGQAWSAETLAGVAGLNGSWVDSAGEATLVGTLGTVVIMSPGGFEFEREDNPAGNHTLHAVYGFEDGSRFAVGGSLLASPPWEGVLIQKLP